MEDLVRREAIAIVFQPIVDLRTARITGYEALSRPDESTGFQDAATMFDVAERLDLYEAVEGLARRKAMRIAARHDEKVLLFLNNSPMVFTSDGFVDVVTAEVASVQTLPPHRVVLEITERTAHGLIPGLSRRSMHLREHGFNVALDDVGAGISGLNQIMSLRPNWIKLDLALVSEIDLDPLKQNLIRSFVHFARLGNMSVVAEGIERDEELRALVELGVSHGQGFYLGRPGVLGASLNTGVRGRILEMHRHAEARKLADPGMVRIGAIVKPVGTCDISEQISEVVQRLGSYTHPLGIVVMDGKRYVGWLDRNDLPALADAVDAPVQIGTLQFTDSPLLGSDWTLAEAMEIAAARPDEQQAQPLIVQDRGEISGILTIRQLLRSAAAAHRRAPSHIAPLTGLPSRVQADRWIAQCIRNRDRRGVAFIDLRDFDAYNIAHGFEKGDEMLLRLVELIKANLVDVDQGAEFFAHLGEDRFMLTFEHSAHERLQTLIRQCNELWPEFFSPLEIAAGSFHYDDAEGEHREYPLMTLRVVYLPDAIETIMEPRELHYVARRLRLREGPGIRGNVITEERVRAVKRRESA